MDSSELDQIERRVRRSYEWSRLRQALLGFAPVLGVVAVAVALAREPSTALAFGLGVFLVGVMLLWYGRDLRRAVLPGVAAGLVPLALALCASHWHHCDAHACTSFCVPACAAGGLLAGLGVAAVGNQRRAGAAYWLPASGLALLTGAMGCSCVGHAGIAGLAIGYGAGVVSELVRRRLMRAQ
jgi:hypothetical protein